MNHDYETPWCESALSTCTAEFPSCRSDRGAPVRVGAQRAASATANGACEQKRAPVFRLQSSGGCAPHAIMRGCGRSGASAWPLAGAGARPPGSHPAQLFSRPSKRVASASRICAGRTGSASACPWFRRAGLPWYPQQCRLPRKGSIMILTCAAWRCSALLPNEHNYMQP